MKNLKKRAIIFIIDALGIGSMPDYKDFDEEEESNTFNSVVSYCEQKGRSFKIPNLTKLGIHKISPLKVTEPISEKNLEQIGLWGKMAELNKAKDTITGHWEMVGIKTTHPFPYYPNGFPESIIEKLKNAFGVNGILCNLPYSGTELLKDYGEEHIRTGFPIIYTSADSVMQIATHSSVVPLEKLYEWCTIAREIMRGEHEVARIIARPFTDNPDKQSNLKFIRQNDKRHDYAVLPHSKSILETLDKNNIPVIGFGKIQDIFTGVGVPFNIHTKNNLDGLEKLTEIMKGDYVKHEAELIRSSKFSGVGVTDIEKILNSEQELLFINLVETDANYGHRRDPEGFARALEEIDLHLGEILKLVSEEDILFISADHGCDPTAAGTDHTREYVPLLIYSPSLSAKDLGTRKSFADIGSTILKWFNLEDSEIAIQGEACV